MKNNRVIGYSLSTSSLCCSVILLSFTLLPLYYLFSSLSIDYLAPLVFVFEKLRCVSLFNSMRTSIFAHYLNKSNEEEHPYNFACSTAALLMRRIQQVAEKHRLRIQV